MLRKIYYMLGPGLRRKVRRLVYSPVDIYDRIRGNRTALVPPKGLIFTGRSDFVQIGSEFREKFINLGNLKPHHRVLDIGCGIGRMARPLVGYLNLNGSYEGFDIVEDGINWCKNAYKDYPNFSFRHMPLRNDLYNLSVDNQAEKLRFPYKDNSFDLVILISVFTHMQEAEVRKYIEEISRVLDKGRRCICTFFIITSQSEQLLDNTPDPFFKYRYNNFFLHNDKVKDANIAYKYHIIEEMAAQSGLKIVTFEPGWWASKKQKESSNFQDLLVLEKP